MSNYETPKVLMGQMTAQPREVVFSLNEQCCLALMKFSLFFFTNPEVCHINDKNVLALRNAAV